MINPFLLIIVAAILKNNIFYYTGFVFVRIENHTKEIKL